MKKSIFIVLAGILLSGCSIPNGSSFSSLHYQPATKHMSSGKARITFVRNRNDNSIPIVTAVSIDDWIVATLGPGEKTTLEVNAGLRHVGLKGKSTPMTLKPARDYYFYIELSKDGTNYKLHSVLESKSKQLHDS